MQFKKRVCRVPYMSMMLTYLLCCVVFDSPDEIFWLFFCYFFVIFDRKLFVTYFAINSKKLNLTLCLDENLREQIEISDQHFMSNRLYVPLLWFAFTFIRRWNCYLLPDETLANLKNWSARFADWEDKHLPKQVIHWGVQRLELFSGWKHLF